MTWEFFIMGFAFLGFCRDLGRMINTLVYRSEYKREQRRMRLRYQHVHIYQSRNGVARCIQCDRTYLVTPKGPYDLSIL